MTNLTAKQQTIIDNLDPISKPTRDKLWDAWAELTSKNDEADFTQFFFNFLLNEEDEEDN